ncbi:cupin domain-containing protein [Prochlorococcus sp. MIT 1341]|uniref:cupin domain-containing protein n=1 Tax=Prochlorococcus sp. MIT 1341 TaxID=3096221 RepID=UPI002A750F98|nr:cupin domain-containing protein [Prochlorococcus sp. MIT 1341]
MRLYRVEVQAGAEIPLHSHPTPLTGHIEKGQLKLTKDSGQSETFLEGDSFVLGAKTPPHTMGNTGNKSAVMGVSVASAEGIPTLTPVQ